MTVLTLTALASAPSEAAEPGLEADFVAAVNRVRADAGLPPLAVYGELTQVARNWADHQASQNTISHNPNLANEVSAPWQKLGENVGTGPTVDAIMQAFVNSPGHYRNIVDPDFEYIGVGVTWGSDGRMYTTHVFMDLDGGSGGTPAPAPAPAPAPTPTPAPRPAATPTTTPPAPEPEPAAPPPPTPPPAAAQPARVAAVLALVGALDGGVK